MSAINPVKFGGPALVIASLLALIGNVLHPRAAGGGAGTLEIDVEANLITGNLGIWYPAHLALAIFPPVALLGFLTVYRVLSDKGERAFSSVALVFLSIATVLQLLAIMIDGFVTPTLAQDYVASTGTARVASASVLEFDFLLTLTLLAPAFFLSSSGIGLWGASLWKAKLYNKWFALAGAVIGLVGVLGYIGGLFGPYWVLSAAFSPYAGILSVWSLILGVFLYRG